MSDAEKAAQVWDLTTRCKEAKDKLAQQDLRISQVQKAYADFATALERNEIVLSGESLTLKHGDAYAREQGKFLLDEKALAILIKERKDAAVEFGELTRQLATFGLRIS